MKALDLFAGLQNRQMAALAAAEAANFHGRAGDAAAAGDLANQARAVLASTPRNIVSASTPIYLGLCAQRAGEEKADVLQVQNDFIGRPRYFQKLQQPIGRVRGLQLPGRA